MTWATDHRPRRFGELVGQHHVAAVLPRMSVAARSGARRFPPALVFYGPRGTGKTTAARIIAKSLNCADPDNDPPGEPCTDCATCLAIDAGTAPGVTEIDAASHGGVEDMRRLKTDSAFSIAEFWRVYLIDEAHAASREAFTALLKLLEEPPPHTLFVLVTTEPERIPDTVRSRAMEFEFRRLSTDDIAERLRAIAQHERVAVESDLLTFLAARARGGMRDAIMALEQVVAAAPPEAPVSLAAARLVLGVSDAPERLLTAALAGDLTAGLGALSEAAYGGTSPAVLADDLLSGLTALVAVRTGLPADRYQDAPVSSDWLAAHALGGGTDALLAAVRELWNARSRIRGHDPASPVHLTAAYLSLVGTLAPGAARPSSPPAAGSAPPKLWVPGQPSPDPALDPEDALDELASL